jgi:predicted metal-binding membrane protein
MDGRPFAATAWFAGGYLLAWTAFSLAATSAQWALERATLLTPMMVSASNILGGVVLIVAGLYQWTPLKEACLSHCQAPLTFILGHGGFRNDPTGALTLGLRHGLYCIVEGDERDRALPHGGAWRPCGALRGLCPHRHRL